MRDCEWGDYATLDNYVSVELTKPSWSNLERDYLGYCFGGREYQGIRPAMWVDLSISDNVSAYEENNNYVDDNSNIDDDIYVDYVEDEIPEDYSNAGNMTKSDTVTCGIKGIDVTFKRADLKQGWVKDVEGRKFYFNTFEFDAANKSTYFYGGWNEIDGKYYYFNTPTYPLKNMHF